MMSKIRTLNSMVSTLTAISFLLLVSVAYADFEFEWITNETHQGQETTTPIAPLKVNILGKEVEVFDDSFALKLHDLYNVYLDNYSWTNEYSYALLNAFEQIPLPYWDTLERSMWHLVDIELDNDIIVLNNGDATSVLLSLHAFTNANAMLAEIDGVRGKLFSKRLHNAVLRYITDHGSNRQRVDYILDERYNVSLHPPDYSELTKHTTGEFSERFTTFKNEEILTLITMLEEFPSGMITTPGLKYLIRRADGEPHPTLPQAAAVAWTDAGYIEFMESAFIGDLHYLQRLILHEKAHFLWAHQFDDQLKEDWAKLGEWYQDKNGKWFTLNETEFVSAYAHGVNPNEDMAEVISYYMVNPDKLRSVSPKKYEFIQNRIMHGDRYISEIREDLTFKVYNLYPDYVYPGKIIRVKIQVSGLPEEDKSVTVELELHHETQADLSAGGYVRIYGPDFMHSAFSGKFIDHFFDPVDTNGNRVSRSNILKTQFRMSKHLPSGYWGAKDIQVWDSNGTPRFTSERKFGWKMYVDNPLQDIKPPEYVSNSLKLSSKEINSPEGSYIAVTATFVASDNIGIDLITVIMNDQDSETYSRHADISLRHESNQKNPRASYNKETGLCGIEIHFPHYMPGGVHYVSWIYISDVADNVHQVRFSKNEQDEPLVFIDINTKSPDTKPPDLDINRISVVANPTHPDNPNGETVVDIEFYVRDDISGYTMGYVIIRDPLGQEHNRRHDALYDYPNDYGTMYWKYDVKKFRKFHNQIILPVGSPPGIWGIAEIGIRDRAGNLNTYDFTENVRFEVSENAPAAPTIVRNALLPNYPNPFNPETWIPYQLANASEVSISIYSVDGKVVRNLNLGYQPAGIYQSRGSAAYWDGRNQLGEPVASGVYFYTLSTESTRDSVTADDFSATRKMLIRK